MGVLYGLVQQHLSNLPKTSKSKLGTTGSADNDLSVSTAGDIWELFRVDRSDVSGTDDIEVFAFHRSLAFWGIGAALADKFIAETIAGAQRV